MRFLMGRQDAETRNKREAYKKQFPVIMQFIQLVLEHVSPCKHFLLPCHVERFDLVELRVEHDEERHLIWRELGEEFVEGKCS